MVSRPEVLEQGEPLDGFDLHELSRVAQLVAQEAATLIFEGRARGLEVRTKSSPTDLVTQMDRAAEALIRARLLELRPLDAILGEEDGLLPGSSGLTWLVDPIDGTMNYVYGLESYSVSVAVATGDVLVPGAWTPQVGCVVGPALGLSFSAVRGSGAHLGGRRLSLAPSASLDDALIASGFSTRASERELQAQVFARLAPKIADLRRCGSAALDLCRVACGQVDAYYEQGLNPWDFAAGWLVATEAGAEVLGAEGAAPSATLVIAARSGLGALLHDQVRGLWE